MKITKIRDIQTEGTAISLQPFFKQSADSSGKHSSEYCLYLGQNGIRTKWYQTKWYGQNGIRTKWYQTKWYGQNGIRTKWYQTKWYGQNGIRTKWYQTKWYGQNCTDKIVWIKYHG